MAEEKGPHTTSHTTLLTKPLQDVMGPETQCNKQELYYDNEESGLVPARDSGCIKDKCTVMVETKATILSQQIFKARERGCLPPPHETVLTTCRVELIKGLKPEDIRNLLLQKYMIDYDEDRELQQLDRKKGVEYIIDIVLNSGSSGLHNFLDVLQQAGYKDLADEIDRAKRKQFPAEINIAFVGKTGVGKSSLANSLLGREAFKCSDGPVSETETSSVESCTKVLHEKNVKINFIDTPGLLDTNLTTYQIMQEIMKCMELAQGKIHIFVIVLKVGRMTKEEQQTIKDIEDRFGDKTESFSLLIFTHKDQLKTKIEEWIAKSPFLAEIVPKFRNRFCAIGECFDKGDDIANIFTKIVQIIEDNNYNYYDNAVFIAAGKAQEKRNEEENRELEEKKKREFEEFKQKYKNEIRQEIKKEIEDELLQSQNIYKNLGKKKSKIAAAKTIVNQTSSGNQFNIDTDQNKEITYGYLRQPIQRIAYSDFDINDTNPSESNLKLPISILNNHTKEQIEQELESDSDDTIFVSVSSNRTDVVKESARERNYKKNKKRSDSVGVKIRTSPNTINPVQVSMGVGPKTSMSNRNDTDNETRSLVDIPVVGDETRSLVDIPVVGDETRSLADIPVVGDETRSLVDIPAVGDETRSLVDIPVVGDETRSLVDIPVVGDETRSLADIPVVGDETRSLVDIPAVGDETRSLVDIPVVGDETRSLVDIPVVRDATKCLADIPVVGDETRSLADIPVVGDETRSLVDIPAVGDETRSLVDIPVVGDETKCLADIPVVGDETRSLVDIPLVEDETTNNLYKPGMWEETTHTFDESGSTSKIDLPDTGEWVSNHTDRMNTEGWDTFPAYSSFPKTEWKICPGNVGDRLVEIVLMSSRYVEEWFDKFKTWCTLIEEWFSEKNYENREQVKHDTEKWVNFVDSVVKSGFGFVDLFENLRCFCCIILGLDISDQLIAKVALDVKNITGMTLVGTNKQKVMEEIDECEIYIKSIQIGDRSTLSKLKDYVNKIIKGKESDKQENIGHIGGIFHKNVFYSINCDTVLKDVEKKLKYFD